MTGAEVIRRYAHCRLDPLISSLTAPRCTLNAPRAKPCVSCPSTSAQSVSRRISPVIKMYLN